MKKIISIKILKKNDFLLFFTADEMSPKIGTQKRICLVGTVLENGNTVAAAQSFGVPVISSETGAEFVADNDWTTFFVMHDFEGDIFKAIQKTKHRILGPPALQHCADTKDGLVHNNRPIYNYSMKGAIMCFTGIHQKDELVRISI